MNRRGVLWVAVLVVLGSLLVACAPDREVNAAFRQGEATWFVFDGSRPNGLREIASLEASQPVSWKPRSEVPVANAVLPVPGTNTGAIGVSLLGLLEVDDSTGLLMAQRPQAVAPLSAYRGLGLFSWKEKVFLTLTQDGQVGAMPATLAWWIPGQTRLALYPIPSQVRQSSRQVVGFRFPVGSDSVVALRWKLPSGSGWSYDTTELDLSTGLETSVAQFQPAESSQLDSSHEKLRSRLAERLGVNVAAKAALGEGTPLLFTDEGWTAVGTLSGPKPKLYRLPDLGPSGHYTAALVLAKGYVLTWETSYRGYAGAAGLVHLPFGLLAP